MKFKIDQKYWPQIQQYLTQQHTQQQKQQRQQQHSNYQQHQQQRQQQQQYKQYNIAGKHINYGHIIAQKLLMQYSKYRESNSNITLSQYMAQYASIFQPIAQHNNSNNSNNTIQDVDKQQQYSCCDQLNYMLNMQQFNKLKSTILYKKQRLQQLLLSHNKSIQQYNIDSQYQDSKQQQAINNISIKIQSIQKHKNERINNNSNRIESKEDIQEQLGRVRSLIVNGLWGLNKQIQDKIDKISILQTEIHELNKTQKCD